ncbi:MAG: alpha/beta fold hydrolase [Aquincola sp.]|nr:alpha/beta fold hydrolase [Aquincola sp.]
MNTPDASPLPFRRAGAGPALVLVHGYLGGSVQWAGEIERFRSHFDVIALDLAGYGDEHAILLRQMRDGNPAARSRLFELIYSDLHVRAANFVRGGGATSLSANSLLHELFANLMDNAVRSRAAAR